MLIALYLVVAVAALVNAAAVFHVTSHVHVTIASVSATGIIWIIRSKPPADGEQIPFVFTGCTGEYFTGICMTFDNSPLYVLDTACYSLVSLGSAGERVNNQFSSIRIGNESKRCVIFYDGDNCDGGGFWGTEGQQINLGAGIFDNKISSFRYMSEERCRPSLILDISP